METYSVRTSQETHVMELCHCWIPGPGTQIWHGQKWPAGHTCNQAATHYIRIGDVVEHVCKDCYNRDTARGAQPATEDEYDAYIGDDEL